MASSCRHASSLHINGHVLNPRDGAILGVKLPSRCFRVALLRYAQSMRCSRVTALESDSLKIRFLSRTRRNHLVSGWGRDRWCLVESTQTLNHSGGRHRLTRAVNRPLASNRLERAVMAKPLYINPEMARNVWTMRAKEKQEPERCCR